MVSIAEKIFPVELKEKFLGNQTFFVPTKMYAKLKSFVLSFRSSFEKIFVRSHSLTTFLETVAFAFGDEDSR